MGNRDPNEQFSLRYRMLTKISSWYLTLCSLLILGCSLCVRSLSQLSSPVKNVLLFSALHQVL